MTRRPGLGDALLVLLLVGGSVSIGLWGPGQITSAAERILGLGHTVRESTPQAPAAPVERALLESVTEADVAHTLARVAGGSSRVPGYAGHEAAARYVRAEFERLGLAEISVDTFGVTVPLDRGAHLAVGPDGERVRLYGLWPNHVRAPTTPSGGLRGQLIDGGQGRLADLEGQVVDGSIVLMGFGCGLDYLSARSLGAAAFVFYDDGQVTREQAADKILRVPVDVPRYWMDRSAAEQLRRRLAEGELTAHLHGRMEWETAPAYNILGYLPGLDEERPGGYSRHWSDDTVVLSAYYDAMSVVPALAPGGDSASGIAALLHLARLLTENRPRYSVLFLATSGHFEGMEGINDFLYRHARKSDYFRSRMADPIDLSLFIGLDLSTRNDQVAAFHQGTFHTGWATNGYLKNLLTPYARSFGEYVRRVYGDEERPRYINAVAPSRKTWKDYMPVGLALEAEAPVFVGLRALALATPNDLRRRADTPLDRVEEVDAAALVRQIRTIGALLFGALSDPGLIRESALQLKDQGHSLAGNVYWFNRDVHFAVPKDPVPEALVTYWQSATSSMAGVRTLMVTQTDSAGHFRFPILRNVGTNRILAYKLGDEGQITWAPDLGSEGAAAFPVEQRYVWWEDEMVQVLFPCRALELYDIVDARQLVALDHPTVLGTNDAPLQWYGQDCVANQSLREGKVGLAAAVYARPGERVKVLLGTGLLGVKYLLTNAPRDLLDSPVAAAEASPALLERARGSGYPVDDGLIRHPLLRSTTDMWVIDDVRMKILERYGIRNERVGRLHELARDFLEEAREALDALDYEGFIAAVRRAAGYESRAYPDVRATANDTVNGIVFYFILLVPFSFFAERLLFGFADIRSQVAGFAGVFMVVFLVLRQVHPAFKLSSSPYIVLLAFIILAMGSVVIVLILAKFRAELAKAKRRDAAVYDSDVGRLSATMAAVLLGVSNLRKRKLRTGLTAITLILLCFTALSFTSISTSIQFYRLPRGDEAPYEGAMIRERNWRGMQPVVLDYVRSAFGDRGVVTPRSWFLLPEGRGRSNIHFTGVESGRESYAYGVVGMGWQEPQVTGLDAHLLPGGRWFDEGERRACILPADMAGLVGIEAADVGRAHIRLLGEEYRVVGLFDAASASRVRDLDGEPLTPVDMVSESANVTATPSEADVVPTSAIRAFKHLDPLNVILLPHDEVIDLGGTVRSVAVAGYRGDLVDQVESFVTRVAYPVFAGTEDGVTVYSSIGVSSLSGVGSLVIPLVIAALIILNTMLGSVYERTREIGIYSSLGLTPLHVSALFMAEAGVFATIGAVMGYLVGQTLALALGSAGMLEGLTLNYSSLSAISSTAIVMLTVFLSTAYPAKKAADMTVPDVTRKWSFGDPEGDDWRFDFPFTVPGHEVEALYAYLGQVFDSYGEGSIGEFLTQDVEFSVAGELPELRYCLDLQTWLAPYDLGIAQRVVMEAIPTGEHGIYRIAMHIQRRSGDTASWKRINRGFLNVLRRRFLVWRTIPSDERERYAGRGAEMVAAVGGGA